MTYKLLIADDEKWIAESLESLEEWQERDIDVVGIASNGQEVVDMLKTTGADIIITDIRMPGMDGLKLLKYVNEHFPHVYVIIISGYSEFSYAQTAIKYKAEAYILKPIDTEELLATVDGVIERMNRQEAYQPELEQFPKTYHGTIVRKAVEYINKNLDKELTLKMVANEVNLTAHYFGQVFKSVTGETFLSYLTQLRMQRACQQLEDFNLTINEVSANVGYRDPKYFSKVFFKTFMMTPSEFRKKLLAEKKKTSSNKMIKKLFTPLDRVNREYAKQATEK